MATSLLPPNATPLERRAAATGAAIGELPTPIRDPQNADLCPPKLLPWLAWDNHVDAWEDTWTEAQKRAVIKAAYQVHKQKGTVGSLEDSLAALGIPTAIIEWWQQQPRATPHTFRVDVDTEDVGMTEIFYQSILRQIQAVKPARSHFTVQLVATARPQLNIAVGVQDLIITSVYPKTP